MPRFSYIARTLAHGTVYDMVAGGVTYTTGWTEAMAREICDDLNDCGSDDASAFVGSLYPEVP